MDRDRDKDRDRDRERERDKSIAKRNGFAICDPQLLIHVLDRLKKAAVFGFPTSFKHHG